MKYIRQKSLSICLLVLVTAFGVLYTKQTEAAYPFGNEVLRYTFEDTATGTTTDGTTGTTTNSGTSGTTNDGLFIGNASTTAAFAKFGSRSASFGEVGDYMRTGYASTTNPTTQSYSVSLWIYKKEASAGCNTGDDDHFFGSSGQPSGSRFYIRCTGGNWGMRFGAAAAANATTGMLHQTWQNIVMVFDATNDQPKLYVDGVQRATSTVVSSFTIKGDFYVGNVHDTITTPGVLNLNEGSNAYIDEVAIYNRALSLSEIAELYAYGTSPNQVTGLTATPYENKVNLAWSSPGGTFTDYKVEYKEGSGPTWLTFNDGMSSTTASTTVTGLTVNRAYDFRVTSLNGAIEGTPSATSTVSTLYRVAFVTGTPAESATVNSSSVTIVASSTIPSASHASSTHKIRLETSSGILVSEVSTTTRYGDYNVTHLTSIVSGLNMSISANSSGAAYATTTNTIFIPHNVGAGLDTTISEIDTDGATVRSIICTACGDIEGIVLLSSIASTTAPGVFDHTFMLSTENETTNARIFRVVIPSTGSVTVNANNYYSTGITHVDNGGLEGIAYNSTSGRFYVARELSTPALYEVTLGSGNSAVSTQICSNITGSLPAAITDFSDLFYKDGVLYVGTEDTNPSRIVPLNITSTSSCSYVDSDDDGDVSSGDTGNWLNNVAVGATDQLEGFTFDTTGDYLYAIGEADFFGKYRTNTFTTQHTFTGLSDGNYVVKSSFVDGNGIVSSSTDRSFSVSTDSVAPIISSVASTTATSTATVAWNTDEAASSKVSYGTVSGGYTTSSSSASYATSHSIGLTGLSTSTRYYFVTVSADAAGNISTSSEYSLLTGVDADVTAPIISSVSTSTTPTTATITWTTNESATSSVEYGATASYGMASSSNTLTTSHSITITGLSESTTYHFRVLSTDASANQATTTDYIFTTTDGTVPVISSIASTTGGTTATITFATNEAASSTVEYGTTLSYGTASTSATTTSHTFNLTGLSAATTYNFRINVRDTASNLATSANYSFTTTAAPDATAPVISSVASTTGSTSATITWTTNETASSQVEYGATSSYGSTTTLSSAMVTSHSFAIAGLSPNTTYHFRVRSVDASSNLATSSDYTFTTAPDTGAPNISAVSATPSDTSVVVTWTTDELASSQMRIGLTTSYGTSTSVRDTSPRVISHSITVTGLTTCTTYEYLVGGSDASSNVSTSTNNSFTTTGCDGNAEVEADAAEIVDNSVGGDIDLTVGNKNIELDIPAGAAGADAVFQIKKIDGNEVIATAGTVSGKTAVETMIFDLQAYDDNEDNISSFVSPIIITMTYEDSDIAGLQESSLVIYRYDGSAWRALNNCSVNISANTISCETNHFSTFGIFGDSSTEARKRKKSSRIRSTSSFEQVAIAPRVVAQNTSIAYQFTRDLELLSIGDDVKELQKFLNAHGYTVAVSGPGSVGNETTRFGDATKTALARYQAAQGIAPVSGYFGPKTRALINGNSVVVTATAASTKRVLQLGDIGDDVKELQKFLNAHGYTVAVSGPGSVGNETTRFGDATKAALIRFQEAYADRILTPQGFTKGTGMYGPATQKVVAEIESKP